MTIKCKKTHQKHSQSQIKSKKLNCVVYSPQRKYITSILGINTSSYLQFKIKTFGLDYQVGRRYSDFIWLRNILRKYYPSKIIPPIPNKKAHKRSNRQLEKRMKILEMFLNDLICQIQFVNCIYVEAFLKFDDKKWNGFKKQIDNKKQLQQSISSTQTLKGQVTIRLSKQTYKYSKYLPHYLQQSQLILKNLTRHHKSVQHSVINQVNTLYQMGDQFTRLYELSDCMSKIYQHNKNNKNSNNIQNNNNNNNNEQILSSGINKLKQIYLTLNNMMVQYGSVLKNQVQIIQKNCNIVYKYIRESILGCKQIIQTKKEYETEYLEYKSQLDNKKQKIFMYNDITRWQIPKKQISFIPKSSLYQKKQAFKLMLPKQSSILQNLKLNYTFYLTQIYHNTDKYFTKIYHKLCQHMQQFTIKQKVINQQIGQIWNQMAANFSNSIKGGTENKNKNKKQMTIKKQDKILEGLDDQIDNKEIVSDSVYSKQKQNYQSNLYQSSSLI